MTENTIDYDKKTNKILLCVSHNTEVYLRVRNTPTAKFEPDLKAWSMAGDFAFYVAGAFPELKQSTAFLEKIADINTRKLEIQKFHDEVATVVDFSKPFGTRTLFAHQIEGVNHILRNEKSIIAADLGTGKSTMALVAMSLTRLPIHVIAPVSLQENWKREAAILNITIDKLMPASNIGEPPDTAFAFICDEVHLMQNLMANRTKKFLNYASKASFMSLLSGTPIKNGRPENIYPLLVAIRHPIAFNKDFFYTRYCKAVRNKWRKRVTKGGANLLELHNTISDKMFIKQKADCLDLPPKSRILTIAEPSDQEQGMFDLIFKALQDRYYKRLRAGTIKENSEALVILSQVRHAASWAKVSTTTRIVEELVKENRPVVIFINYKDSAEALKSELEVLCPTTILTSDITPIERDIRVQDFQAGKYKAIICTFGTGGVGITLTAASDVILVDRPWAPGEALQSEDRVHRIGTVNPVMSIWIQQHQVDKKIDALLLEKQKNVSEVMLGTRDTIEFNDTIEGQAEAILADIF